MSKGPSQSLLVLVSLIALTRAAAGQPLPVGSEFRVNTVTNGVQTQSDKAFDAAGNFVIVWTGNSDVHGQRFDRSGNPLGSEFQINTFTPLGQGSSAVAANDGGGFVVVWESAHQDGHDDGVFGRRYDASGSSLGGEFQVNTTTEQHQNHPDVTSAPDGSFVVVWTSKHQGFFFPVILAQRYDASGQPIGDEFQVNTKPMIAPLGRTRTSIASNRDGDFVVVWSGYDVGTTGIFGRRFDLTGQPLGPEFLISRLISEPQGYPSIASDAEGNFVVAWSRRFEKLSTAQVFGRRFDVLGNAVGAEFRVNSDASEYAEYPSTAMDEDGDFIVAWHSTLIGGGTTRHVRAQAFDESGNPLGEEFQVNPYTQSGARVSAGSDAEGNLVLSWTYTDIFAQRYAGPGIHLEVDGSCPGPVTVTVLQAPPNSEVGIVVAANIGGFTKGGTLCAGTELEVGEPFALPPHWMVVDGNGGGSALVNLPPERCYLEALALADCTTSGAVHVP